MIGEDIFEVKDGLLIINKDYCRGIPEFRTILERDKGSKGDNDGRKKFQAFKELFYIHLRASLFSYINEGGYSDKDAHIQALKDAQLPPDWKPDAAIKACIEKYREMQLIMMPTLNSILTVNKALRLTDILAQKILGDIEKAIEYFDEKAKDPNRPPDNIAAEAASHDALIAKIDQVMGMAKKLPIHVETLDKLKERLMVEKAGSSMIRGGKEKGNRADPT